MKIDRLYSSFLQRKDKESLITNKILAFVVCLFVSLTASADNITLKISPDQAQVLIEHHAAVMEITEDTSFAEKPVRFKRGKAIIFTVLTGLFGGHRIYLGTHHRTPILYSVTLGGLGILPLIDLINIVFTKDLEKFEDVPQIIMWGR